MVQRLRLVCRGCLAATGDPPVGVRPSTVAGSPVYWGCATTSTTCDHALNKGDTKGDCAKYYLGQHQAESAQPACGPRVGSE